MDEAKKAEAEVEAKAPADEGEGAVPETGSKAGMIRTIALVALMVVVALLFLYVKVWRLSARYYAGQLKSPEVTTRIKAVNALSEMLENRELRRENTPEAKAKFEKMRAKGIAKMKSVIPELIMALRDEATPVRAHALHILKDASVDNEKAIALLIESLDSGTTDSKRSTIGIFPALGPKAKAAVDALLKQTDGEELILRTAALGVLVRIAPDEPKVIERVFNGFGDKNNTFRSEISRHAATMANQNQELVARIIKELEVADANRRVTAMKALFSVRPQDDKMTALFFKALKNSAIGVRKTAAGGLLGIARSSKPIRARLQSAIVGLDAQTQGIITAGLTRIEKEEQARKKR